MLRTTILRFAGLALGLLGFAVFILHLTGPGPSSHGFKIPFPGFLGVSWAEQKWAACGLALLCAGALAVAASYIGIRALDGSTLAEDGMTPARACCTTKAPRLFRATVFTASVLAASAIGYAAGRIHASHDGGKTKPSAVEVRVRRSAHSSRAALSNVRASFESTDEDKGTSTWRVSGKIKNIGDKALLKAVISICLRDADGDPIQEGNYIVLLAGLVEELPTSLDELQAKYSYRLDPYGGDPLKPGFARYFRFVTRVPQGWDPGTMECTITEVQFQDGQSR